ncbi:MAG: hypothetical protein K2O30_09665, partial [Duncaniella sp.]|nr:hypothetical protein [Duncaniella sp.]
YKISLIHKALTKHFSIKQNPNKENKVKYNFANILIICKLSFGCFPLFFFENAVLCASCAQRKIPLTDYLSKGFFYVMSDAIGAYEISA